MYSRNGLKGFSITKYNPIIIYLPGYLIKYIVLLDNIAIKDKIL